MGITSVRFLIPYNRKHGKTIAHREKYPIDYFIFYGIITMYEYALK